MTTSEMTALWMPVANMIFRTGRDDTNILDHHLGDDLDNFLGISEYRNWENSREETDKPMGAELKQLLEAFLGPHGETMIKVYQIKKGMIGDEFR